MQTQRIQSNPQYGYVMIKPDGVKKKAIGQTINRLEEANYDIIGLKMFNMTKPMAERHYAEHKTKPFFKDIVDMVTGTCVAIAVKAKGFNPIEGINNIVGATKGNQPGTLRQKFLTTDDKGNILNAIHRADSQESVNREMNFYLNSGEVFNTQA